MEEKSGIEKRTGIEPRSYLIGLFVAVIAGVSAWNLGSAVYFGINTINKPLPAASIPEPNQKPAKERNFPRYLFGGEVVEEDFDLDGKKEDVLYRKNSDWEFAKILLRKGLEGKIEFPNLSASAVTPSNIPTNLNDLKIDYQDLDGDGKLESITYFKFGNDTQKMRLEKLAGKYVLTPIYPP